MLKYGATAGIAAVFFVSCLYNYQPRLLVEGYENINWLFILIAMFMASFAYIKKRKFAATPPLLKLNFQTFIIAYLVKYVFILALFYTDDNLVNLVNEAQLQIYLSQKDNNLPEEIFQQQLANFKQMQSHTGIFDFLGLIIHLLMGFILSLSLAFVMKREELD